MKYLMLIYQGTALEGQAALPEEEQKQVSADYQGIKQTPGVTPGVPMGPPENATTVRVEGGKTLTNDGPFVGMKEAVGGWFVLEADDLDASRHARAYAIGPYSSRARAATSSGRATSSPLASTPTPPPGRCSRAQARTRRPRASIRPATSGRGVS
jgi:hypothetical protein